MEKICFKCKRLLDLSEFYKHKAMADGHLNKCKVCTKKDVSGNYRVNKVHYQEYEKGRSVSRWEYISKRTSQWREKNPEKYKAQVAVSNALRDGKLKKLPCFICGKKDVHGHHYDYSKPLKVIWVCEEHHGWMHGRTKTHEQINVNAA